jgi:hypothetical protein
MLIWAGSCLFRNENVFDFRATKNLDQTHSLSFIVTDAFKGDTQIRPLRNRSRAIIIDDHFTVSNIHVPQAEVGALDIHEFRILEEGRTALYCVHEETTVDLADIGRSGEKFPLRSNGFVESNLATGKIVFKWNSLDHISLSESMTIPPENPDHGLPVIPAWDYL